jgi:DNA-binding MarR family transcriptional regulator
VSTGRPRTSNSASALRTRAAGLRAGLQPLGASFAWRTRDVAKLYGRAITEALERHGLTYGNWRALRVLWEGDGITQRELAVRLDMTSAATVFAVNLLERDGLARRVPDPSDARRLFVKLTAKGKGLRDIVLPECRELNLRIASTFSDRELVVLDDLLTRLQQRLEEELVAQRDAIA